ncbi:hypothetical protein WN944_029199 [Citrus x changshan-huyou]|uniref:Uncharacterized protein n=1 Tax=Citrus x changshan-huyou TaxID=2935761 RepID=A0AAP0LLN7_9ROSI
MTFFGLMINLEKLDLARCTKFHDGLVHLNETRQAIGRPFRPGQTKKVYAYRLVAAESPQEEDHPTCLKKELISRMWFEWNDYCGYKIFQVETVDVNDCGDLFLESQLLKEGRSKHLGS